MREPVSVARLHVIDSLSALPILRRLDADGLLDLGSGGGFPGIPLAAALPSWHGLLVDSTGKKAAFLVTAVRAVGLRERVAVAPVRAEALALDKRHRGRWPVVTARAVGSLAELIELAFPLLSAYGRLVAWKRGPLEAELASAGRALDAIGGGQIEVVDTSTAGLAGHRLAIVTKGGPTPAGYPRDPADRRRRPW
ncbi:MAG: class I SAM-dependent methyltransferase [Chloroflexota bacterium]|nr:class I SAM-dependent methyltransferase [Chloroflexota bacterium]